MWMTPLIKTLLKMKFGFQSLLAKEQMLFKKTTRPRLSRLYCLVSHRDRYSDLLFSTSMVLIFKSTLSVLTTFFVHSKAKDLANCVVELNDAISRLGDHSSESKLALNEAKTKWMLVSTRQMSRAHALHDYYPAVSCYNGKLLHVSPQLRYWGSTWTNI